MRTWHREKLGMLDRVSSLLTPEMADDVARSYPQFRPILDHWRLHGRISRLQDMDLGEAPSVFRDFVQFTLGLVAEHPKFDSAATKTPTGSQICHHQQPKELVNLRPASWALCDGDKIARMRTILGIWPSDSPSYEIKQISNEFCLSVASMAIEFLQSLQATKRIELRHITLLEDRTTIAHPEYHARGFIPLCQKNLRLRIERRASLWTNIFLRDSCCFSGKEIVHTGGILVGLEAHHITRLMGPWITEALALTSLGMPPESFTLVIDGEPILEKSSEVFGIVQRDAAWQAALDECYSRQLLPKPSWIERRLHPCYMFEGLPQALSDIVSGNSLVRCNFPTGELWTMETVLGEHEEWSSSEWGI
ncbi:hypothetical protein BDV95DRAFT_599820 [Massariosphaeria phaeospora]|uniref:Uncharacterized protein n=1 Tax=Massariosphaeria phaeospora TaxID=100035 RepID=A0A7C8HYQ7_9PLEO|nr:hypothetical protein BDV95DRAFT_599820 [Massariosphaeria phaeospora]